MPAADKGLRLKAKKPVPLQRKPKVPLQRTLGPVQAPVTQKTGEVVRSLRNAAKIRGGEAKDVKSAAEFAKAKPQSAQNIRQARLDVLRSRPPTALAKKVLPDVGKQASKLLVDKVVKPSLPGAAPAVPAMKGLKKAFKAAAPKQYKGAEALTDQAKQAAKKLAIPELEGRGVLAKYTPKLLSKVVPDEPPTLHAKAPYKGGKLAFATLAPKQYKEASALAGRFKHDIVNAPAQVGPSVYIPAAAGVEATKGRPERAKEYWKNFKRTDPLYNLATLKPGKAGKLAYEHPGYAALEVAGTKGILGRGMGRVMRSRVAPKSWQQAASTERAPKRLPSTNVGIPREYSPDVISKGLRVAADNFRRKQSQRAAARGHKDQAKWWDPDRVTEHDINMVVDERVGLNQGVRMRNRKLEHDAAKKELKHKGLPDSQIDAIVRARTKHRALEDEQQGHLDFGDEVGYRQVRAGKKGAKPELKEFKTYGDAERFAKNVEQKTGRKLKPIQRDPIKPDKQRIKDELAENDDIAQHQLEHETSRLKQSADQPRRPGKYILADKPAVKRYRQHAKVDDPEFLEGTGVRRVSQMFTRAVLAPSTSYVTGNIQEALLRSGLIGAGPRSRSMAMQAAKRLEEIDPKAAQEFQVGSQGGGIFGAGKRIQHRTGKVPIPGHDVPIPKGLQKGTDAYNKFIETWFETNRRVESQFQSAIAGRKLIDDVRHLPRKQRVNAVAEKLQDPVYRRAVQRYVDRHFGKYDSESPRFKIAQKTVTPFIAWPRNSARFLARLPEDHPLVTLAAASGALASEKERKATGADILTRGQKPAFLQGGVVDKKGQTWRPGKFTPFGVANDPAGVVTGLITPQISSALAALRGQDFAGRPLKSRHEGETADIQDRLTYLLKEQAKVVVPFVQIGSRLYKKGLQGINPYAPIKPGGKSGGGQYESKTGFTMTPGKRKSVGPGTGFTLKRK